MLDAVLAALVTLYVLAGLLLFAATVGALRSSGTFRGATFAAAVLMAAGFAAIWPVTAVLAYAARPSKR